MVDDSIATTIRNMPPAMVNVVAQMPWPLLGDTKEKTTPTPKATRNKVMAADVTAPAMMAFQLTADSASSAVTISISVIDMNPASMHADACPRYGPTTRPWLNCSDGALFHADAAVRQRCRLR